MKLLVYNPDTVTTPDALASSLGTPATTASVPPRYAAIVGAFASYAVVYETWASVTVLMDPTPAQVAALVDPGPDPAIAAQANAATLRSKAAAALTANTTYLAIASPTNAQVVAQVAALTRQTNAVIRLLVGHLDSTAGS